MKKSLLFTLITLLLSLNGLYANEAKIKRFNKSFDKNSDGVVSQEEYITTRTKWGKPEEESARLFKYHDKNKDGKVTLEEFLSSK